MMSRILFLLLIVLPIFACSTSHEIYSSPAIPEKSAYYIEIVINGDKNKDIQLYKYVETGIYPVDTTVIDKNGKAIFAGNTPLVPGVYMVLSRKKPIFDFIISDTVNQKFSISTTKDEYLETLLFKASPENEVFAEYSRYIVARQEKENQLSLSTNSEIDSLTKQIDSKEAEIKAKFPGSLLESMAMAMNPIRPKRNEIPETSDATKLDYLSEFRKLHYWDKLTLTDQRMLNTPILIPAIDEYFDKMVLQIPDSIICSIDRVLSKAEGDSVMMNFLTKYIFDKYFNLIDYTNESRIMGMENVVVHLIDNYYLSGKVNVNDMKFLIDITEYAKRNRTTLIGKQAKELKMETINGGAESLYDIDSPYTLVCFFDASCSHCKHEIPEVYKIFQKYKDKGLVGFCIYIRSDKKEWLEFVAKYKLTDWINVWDPKNENDFRIAYGLYSVPQVYVLDKDKKIVGRGLESASLARLLNELIKKYNR